MLAVKKILAMVMTQDFPSVVIVLMSNSLWFKCGKSLAFFCALFQQPYKVFTRTAKGMSSILDNTVRPGFIDSISLTPGNGDFVAGPKFFLLA
jgi:hypothetical protein